MWKWLMMKWFCVKYFRRHLIYTHTKISGEQAVVKTLVEGLPGTAQAYKNKLWMHY